ncbi:MAG: adenosylmethionine--8-amino-7-oxononanoate transaminase [Acidobacteria bacterium]|nr:adenosylmethionine--8-amino-7-oxononanoate transaminase [Acidobacteriota bacterium]
MTDSDRRHVWHPYTQMALDSPPLPIVRAEGVYLYTEDGRRILDGISSWWVTLHGHGHPRIAAAVARQAAELDHVIFAGFTHRSAAQLAEKLARILPPGLTRIFYSDDGSTAVEVALKMALQYWANRGEPRRRRVIALQHAYHGDTVGAMSVGERSVFTEPFSSFLFPVLRAHTAYCYRCPLGLRRETCAIDCADHCAELLASFPGEVAAVIVEPLLQGAGGMIVQPVEFLQKIEAACRRHNVLLIADEVLTGFGRTGAWFACEKAGVVPDLICLSKGLTGGFLPLAVTACREEVYEAFLSEDRRKTFFHGHSYTANPLGCAAALANLQIFEEEPVFDRIRQIEQVHRERLGRLAAHPRVGDARSIGAVAAVELRDEAPGYLAQSGRLLYGFFLEQGVLLRPLGNVIYLLPPYSIPPEELHRAYDIIEASLEWLSRAENLQL